MSKGRGGDNVWHAAHLAVIGTRQPSWADPAAIMIAIGGLSIAALVMSAPAGHRLSRCFAAALWVASERCS
jgi:hypothetical protein